MLEVTVPMLRVRTNEIDPIHCQDGSIRRFIFILKVLVMTMMYTKA
jgi:hypothetical protein